MNEDTAQSESFRVIDRQAVFLGRAVDVYVGRIEHPNGSISQREIVTHPGAVAIVPRLSSGRIVLVRQERPAAGRSLWEIPAGTLEPEEALLDCARRELAEETGYEADSWREVITFYTTPGFSNEQITLFFADGLREIGQPDPDEIAECRAFSPVELAEMIDRGDLSDAKTILGLLSSGLLHPLEGAQRS